MVGFRSTTVYDVVGRPEAQIDALGYRATTGYDALGQQRASRTRGEGANGAFSYVVAAEFANGAAGLINMTSCAPHVVAEMEIVGDGRSFIHISNMESIRYEGGAWPYPRLHEYDQREPGYFEEVQDFCRALLRGEPTYATFADEVKALEICQAICASADANGERVAVESAT